MPGASYNRLYQRYAVTGVDTYHPVDLLPQGRVPYMQNLRVNQDGDIIPRQGTVRAFPSALADLNVHSIRRLNNLQTNFSSGGSAPLPFCQVIGAGTNLYAGQIPGAKPVQIDSGYDGNPLSLIPFQPVGAVESWMYVSDALRSRKVRGNAAFTNYQVGINNPVNPPTANYGKPAQKVIEPGSNGGSFTASGNAGAITSGNRVNTTISAIVYDSGTSNNWACIVPVAMDSNMQPGTVLVIASAETVIAREVFEPITNTTALAFSYDAGTSGPCTVAITTPSTGLRPNAIVLLNSGGGNQEYVRVISVTTGQDPNYISFRCNTVNLHVGGETINGVPSFRAFCVGTRSAGNTITSAYFGSAVNVPGGSSTGLGQLARFIGPGNFSSINNRAVQQDDYIHISVWIDNPANVVQGNILIDIDPATVNVGTAFQGNYYSAAFRPNDLQPNVSQQQTVTQAQQQAVQNLILGDVPLPSPSNPIYPLGGSNAAYPGVDPSTLLAVGVPTDGGQGIGTTATNTSQSTQQVTGAGQWTEIVVKVASLNRQGSGVSTSLSQVQAIGIQLQVLGTVNIRISSWWIGGTYGADVGQTGSPGLYAYRYRSSLTGAVSNPSPANRSGVNPLREQVIVGFTASTDPQVDQIEIFRFGMGVDSWHKIAQIPNATSTYQDNFTSLSIVVNDPLPFTNFVPFPTTDVPRQGTCNIVGTHVVFTGGDQFNVNWVAGSIIVINGVPQQLYANPSSPTGLDILDSGGYFLGVKFYLPSATIQGQPLPATWASGIYVFGVGDPNNPGTLRWCNPNDPDSASDTNFLNITSPSEPLMNGFDWNGTPYVFSSDRLFAIYPSLNQPNQFYSQEIPDGTGLVGRYAFTAKGANIFWVGRSGVYAWNGGQPKSMTNTDLYNIFPHDGTTAFIPPVTEIAQLIPPDFTLPNFLRLEYTEDGLFFTYVDVYTASRARHCLRFDFTTKGWFPYELLGSTSNVLYAEEGQGVESTLVCCDTGLVYQLSSLAPDDDGTPFFCRIRSQAVTAGDYRALKQWMEAVVDIDASYVTGGITALLGFNSFQLSPVTPTVISDVTGSIGRQQFIIDNFSTAPQKGIFAVNVQIDLSWSTAYSIPFSTLPYPSPIMFGWEPSYLPKPEISQSRPTDWDDVGYIGAKYVQGFILHADTFGNTKSIQVQTDNPTGSGSPILGPTLSITINGESEVAYSLDPPSGIATSMNGPIIGHLLRIVPLDEVPWRFFGITWVYEPAPEYVDSWITQPTTHDLPGYHHHRDGYIAVLSSNNVTLNLGFDGINPSLATSYQIPSTAGLYSRVYVVFRPAKSKYTQYSLTGGPFRLFQKDCEVRVKAWGDPGPYQSRRPFGGPSRQTGAVI